MAASRATGPDAAYHSPLQFQPYFAHAESASEPSSHSSWSTSPISWNRFASRSTRRVSRPVSTATPNTLICRGTARIDVGPAIHLLIDDGPIEELFQLADVPGPRSCRKERGPGSVTVGRSAPGRLARRGIEEQVLLPVGVAFRLAGEGEQVVQTARFLVEGEVADPAGVPVVLDEPQDRGLVGCGVVDEVGLRKGGDHDQGQARTVAAPVLEAARDTAGVGTAGAVLRQPIMQGIVRLVDDRAHLMVVPAIAVVVGDHHCGALPVRGLLEPVDGLDKEALLIQRAGVPGVPVLVGRGLEEADRRHRLGVHRRPEVGEVVLVVRRPGVADLGYRCGRGVLQVRGARVVLERLVVRDVVLAAHAADVVVSSKAVGEAALEPAPRGALGVEQVTYVLVLRVGGGGGG